MLQLPLHDVISFKFACTYAILLYLFVKADLITKILEALQYVYYKSNITYLTVVLSKY